MDPRYLATYCHQAPVVPSAEVFYPSQAPKKLAGAIAEDGKFCVAPLVDTLTNEASAPKLTTARAPWN